MGDVSLNSTPIQRYWPISIFGPPNGRAPRPAGLRGKGPGPQKLVWVQSQKLKGTPQVFLVPYIVLMEPFDGAQLPTPIPQPLWSTWLPHFGSFLALKGPLVGPQICFDLRGGVQPLLEGQWRETPPDLFYPKWYLLQIYHIGLAPQSLLQELAMPP